MKVKVHTITKPYDKIETASLQAFLRNHAHDRLRCQIRTKQLFDIIGELVRHRQASGDTWRSNEDAWKEFAQQYCPVEPSEEQHIQELLTLHTLTPSFHGAECLGNGDWIGYECQCDECPFFLQCFPEFG